jgi:hypothetical protein
MRDSKIEHIAMVERMSVLFSEMEQQLQVTEELGR